jgi:hypothetical protein
MKKNYKSETKSKFTPTVFETWIAMLLQQLATRSYKHVITIT